jgi:hypothetical protein
MDDRKASLSSHDPGGRVGADAAPIAPGVRRSTDVEHKLVLPAPDQARRLPANPLREDLVVVYCGNAQRVNEGFAIALRALGIEGHVGLSTTNHNKEDHQMRIVLWLVVSIFAASFTAVATAQEIDWQKIDGTLGRKPAVSGDVHRYGFPRTDLTVTLDGVTIKPALALGGWVAFKPMDGGAMVMGDLVLLETEINPVMLQMIEGGLEITAVHNHLLRASPATFYMHIGGHGDPAKMAAVIHDALAASKTPLSMPAAAAVPPAVDLDTAQLDQIMGAKGQANGGVYQFNVPRRDAVTMDGMAMTPPAPLGAAIGINFQPTGAGKAAITGDFVLIKDEVNPVIRALRANGIDVTAVHSHMLDEQPRLFFLHFWAVDDAMKLAKGLRAALDKTASEKS